MNERESLHMYTIVGGWSLDTASNIYPAVASTTCPRATPHLEHEAPLLLLQHDAAAEQPVAHEAARQPRRVGAHVEDREAVPLLVQPGVDEGEPADKREVRRRSKQPWGVRFEKGCR